MGCIYRCYNTENGKSYIGQFKNNTPTLRWNRHVRESKKESHPCKFHEAIKKYGKDKFEVSVLCICDTQEELDKKEDEFITEHKSMINENGYNMVRGGKGRAPNFHHKEEHRKKMSELMKNRIVSEETRKKISDARKDKPTSEAHKTSISEFQQKKFIDETFPKRLAQWIVEYNKKGSTPDCNSDDADERHAGQWRIDMLFKREGLKSRGRLTEEQIKTLDETSGWTWRKDEFLEQFNNFKKQYLAYDGKLSDGKKDLNHIERYRASLWVKAMRMKKRTNHKYLTPERIKMLDDCEFWSWTPTCFTTFDQHVNNWVDLYTKIRRIPSTGSEDPSERKIAEWQNRMRKEYHHKENRMTQARIDTLNSLQGWIWSA